jgi:DNA-binding MarR family transcriptional regulator
LAKSAGKTGRGGEPHIEAFNTLVEETAALFHRLRAIAEILHEQGEMSGGRRSVLLGLERLGPQTVPQMARARPVSRQHIQILVNGLLEDEYVELIPNPAHKRSGLVQLTAKGREFIVEMRKRELEMHRLVDLGVTAVEMASASEILQVVREALSSADWVRAAERVRRSSVKSNPRRINRKGENET